MPSYLESKAWSLPSLAESLDRLDRTVKHTSIEDFVCILQKCRQQKDIACAKRAHEHVRRAGLEDHGIVGNHIVPMYVDCGSIHDAQEVFGRLCYRNVYSYTSLMLAYIEHVDSQHAVSLYEEMQRESVLPSKHTFVALVKSSDMLKDVHKVHGEVVIKGFEAEIFVGNTLVDMYNKYGSPKEAQQVFDNLPVRNEVSWNALLSGYAEWGPREDAWKCFKQMQVEGFSPDEITYVCILKAYGNTLSRERCCEIHMEITVKGLETCLSVGNTLIDMFTKCCLIPEARYVFDRLPARSVVSWNALISGYGEHGHCKELLTCFRDMQKEDICQNSVSFICLLKACGSLEGLHEGRELHVMIIQQGLERESYLGSTLVDMYSKCGSMAEACRVFAKLPSQCIVSWNALISGFAEHGPCQEALQCLKQLQVQGLSANDVTYVSVLKACASLSALERGREMLVQIILKGYERDVYVGSALIDMLVNCGSLTEAQSVFDKLPAGNVVSWTALIAGYASQGLVREAVSLFDQIYSQDVASNTAMFLSVLGACNSVEALDLGRKLHLQITSKGSERDSAMGNTLIDMYFKCRSRTEAEVVFHMLPDRDVVSWNCLIAGYAEEGFSQEAWDNLEKMKRQGFSPSDVTLASVLKACVDVGSIDKGLEMHKEMTWRGLEGDVFVANTLIDMYAKCGSLVDARKVFACLPALELVTWNSMIKGYGMNHEGKLAVQLFEVMEEKGVKPDAITFTCLLNACSHASLLAEGQEVFRAMTRKYHFVPRVDHIVCMVDLFARSGRLFEAEKFLKSLPDVPSQELWNALLAACKTYAEPDIGYRCFHQLVHLKPEYATPYLLMADISKSVGKLDELYGLKN